MTFTPGLIGAVASSGVGFAYSTTGTTTTGTDGSHTWIKWTSSGTFVTSGGSVSVDALVVAGGAGAGGQANANMHGGGGGAGGMQTVTST